MHIPEISSSQLEVWLLSFSQITLPSIIGEEAYLHLMNIIVKFFPLSTQEMSLERGPIFHFVGLMLSEQKEFLLTRSL